MKIVCTNRKAWHDYHILETFEAGISLLGTEVKSLRSSKANLKEGFVKIEDRQAFLFGCHISKYSCGNRTNHEPTRIRKLLLHRREIDRLEVKVKEKGLTIIPLKLYFKNNKAKLEIAIAKGKRLYDKRETIKRRIAQEEAERALKEGKRQNY